MLGYPFLINIIDNELLNLIQLNVTNKEHIYLFLKD